MDSFEGFVSNKYEIKTAKNKAIDVDKKAISKYLIFFI
jgi:hypothetical protein